MKTAPIRYPLSADACLSTRWISISLTNPLSPRRMRSCPLSPGAIWCGATNSTPIVLISTSSTVVHDGRLISDPSRVGMRPARRRSGSARCPFLAELPRIAAPDHQWEWAYRPIQRQPDNVRRRRESDVSGRVPDLCFHLSGLAIDRQFPGQTAANRQRHVGLDECAAGSDVPQPQPLSCFKSTRQRADNLETPSCPPVSANALFQQSPVTL